MVRRFELGEANQPIIQFMIATFPFFLLLLWFLQQAAVRQDAPCYENLDNVNDDAAITEHGEMCASLIPLKQFVYVFLVAQSLWMMLGVYVSFYVPRRHALVKAYLTQGQTAIGNVYYEHKRGVPGLTSYGHVVYPYPSDSTKKIRRSVQIFERYTRERAAILYLPGKPCSGQPKTDLEIDQQVTEINQPRLRKLCYFAWSWTAFCVLAPVYIVAIMNRLDTDDAPDNAWQPDVNLDNFPKWFYATAFGIIPVAAFLWNVLAWCKYTWWTTSQSRVLTDSEATKEVESRNSCADDTNPASIDTQDYKPPRETQVV